MYILAPNQTAEKYPYSIGQLRRDNPNTSFPKRPSDATLAEWGVYPVTRVDRPEHDAITQTVTEGAPKLVKGEWRQTWVVTDASAEEIAERKERALQTAKNQRAAAYRDEADPLFFKYQRGEASEQEWLDKVEEIRERFPYPDEG